METQRGTDHSVQFNNSVLAEEFGSCQYGRNPQLTVCRQLLRAHKLLSLSTDGKLVVDSFQLPSGCACYIKDSETPPTTLRPAPTSPPVSVQSPSNPQSVPSIILRPGPLPSPPCGGLWATPATPLPTGTTTPSTLLPTLPSLGTHTEDTELDSSDLSAFIDYRISV